MKKKIYTQPSVLVVEMDMDAIMVNVAGSTTNGTPNVSNSWSNDEVDASSYRNNLWN